jgi:chromosome segregation ATPase
VSDWQALGVSSLSEQVRELGAAVEAIAGQLPELAQAVARTDADVDRLVAERAETGEAINRHDRELSDLVATVKRLATQVTWIERHIRSSDGVRTADLDHIEPELTALAATSEAGHRAGEEVLAPFVRAALETTLTSHREAAGRYRDAALELLDSCDRLVETAPDTAAHRQARSDYRAARSGYRQAESRVDVLTEQARSARDRLAADDTARRRTAATVAAGQRAEVELMTRLRTTLATAVGDGALLPPWLTGPLGPMPPAGAGQRWMDVAAGLIAYRITYSVQDPDDALGEPPEDAAGYRRRWHAELGRGVRELRR